LAFLLLGFLAFGFLGFLEDAVSAASASRLRILSTAAWIGSCLAFLAGFSDFIFLADLVVSIV